MRLRRTGLSAISAHYSQTRRFGKTEFINIISEIEICGFWRRGLRGGKGGFVAPQRSMGDIKKLRANLARSVFGFASTRDQN
jgi:hypothetical protein